jgi:hypothetical protein
VFPLGGPRSGRGGYRLEILPFREQSASQASQAVAGWAAAWAGCKVVGVFGAGFGTGLEPGGGTAVGGFVGCIIGGAVGYYASSEVAGEV